MNLENQLPEHPPVAFGPKRDSCFGAKRESRFGPKRDSHLRPKPDSENRRVLIYKNLEFWFHFWLGFAMPQWPHYIVKRARRGPNAPSKTQPKLKPKPKIFVNQNLAVF
jgi:hypothetical protein